MGQVVYADLLFLVNFSMDFLCFFVTTRLLRRPFRVWRSILASAMGGVYSVAILFVNFKFIPSLVADLGFCILMCLCAIGLKNKKTSEFFLYTSVYFGVSMGTGGCMTAMYSLLNRLDLPLSEVKDNPDGISVWLFGLLAVASGIVAMAGGKMFKNASATEISTLEITYGGRTLTLRGMVDTGNMLKDPISGKPVIIIDKKSLEGLIPRSILDKAMRGDITGILEENYENKVRLVSMKTASGSSMVCAFIPQKITAAVSARNGKLKGTEIDALFAPADICLTSDKIAMGCAALLPRDLIY